MMFNNKEVLVSNNLDNQYVQNIVNQLNSQDIEKNITNIARDSLYLGLFEGIKILIFAFAAGLFIRYMYKKFSTSYSSRDDYGNTILIVIISVSALIAVVKSSLALSLGLVGALSVVRFRTAVKEPVNLGFLLFTICIGIAIGASQFLFGFITLFLGSIAIIFLYLKTGVKSQIDHQKDSSIDSISLTLPIDINLKEIFKLLSEDSDFYDIQTFEQVSETRTCNLTFKVKFKSLDSLDNFRNKIKDRYKDANLIFFNSPIY